MPSSPDIETSFHSVSKLVSEFSVNEHYYLSPKYQESEARQDFIDKLWDALGWDVYHQKTINPYEREVKIEQSVIIDGRGKRADYAFFTAPNFTQVRFLAEAKKPSKNLENNQDCFQAVRYGWNSNTPISVLTDFEQFLVLDSRYKPDVETSVDRIMKKFHYTELTDEAKFREIYFLFSRDSVLKNSLENFAATLAKFRGARQAKLFQMAQIQPVDETFLSELDKQREELARSFKTKNINLQKDELTEITQRTLDRLVFIRFLEDKLVEPTEIIDNLGTKSGSAWRDFIAEMPRLNRVYNGIIFKPHDILDDPDFAPDESIFEIIRDWLAHKNSAYDFNSIPIHILGSIYERFLGKTIETIGNSARVVDKPEVRKAGGVYYTPEYIVRCIVENTIGKLIKKKKPEEIAAMRFADIACGSGSFLLGIFDYLISYHVEYFSENKSRRDRAVKDGLCRETIDGTLQLTIQYKRDILLNNIYGVDLDAQAVEVAQLSLYLKLLEEETTATKQQFLAGFREQLLPNLNKNIVHGNSLVDYDIMDGMLFDTPHLKQLNPMNFKSSFPEIVDKGGFDAIVGNPPYIRIQGFPKEQIKYFSKNYLSSTGNFDIYVNFIERAFNLLKPVGLLGEIIPNKFIKTDYGIGLRRFISDNKCLSQIVDFGSDQVFEATTYTCLLFLSKAKEENFDYALSKANQDALVGLNRLNISTERLKESAWILTDNSTSELLEKIEANSSCLLELPAEMSRGSSSGDDKIFILDFDDDSVEEEITRIPLFATDFTRYAFNQNKKWKIIFPYEINGDKAELLSEEKLQTSFPKTYKYLSANRLNLEKRKQFKTWFSYSAPRNLVLHDSAQMVVPLLANRGLFTLLPEHLKGKLCPMASGGFTITLDKNCKLKPEYVLALLNSKLLFWKLENMSNVFRGGWITCTKQYLGALPIRTINFSNPLEIKAHDQIVEVAGKLLEAKKLLANAHTDKDKQFYEHLCNSLDWQIDDLIYNLYNLSEKDQKIINKLPV